MPSVILKQRRSTGVISTSRLKNFEGLGSSPSWTVQCHISYGPNSGQVKISWPDLGPTWPGLGPSQNQWPSLGPSWPDLGPSQNMLARPWAMMARPRAKSKIGGPTSGQVKICWPDLGPTWPGLGPSSKNGASSGNRTRATCLEGRYSNH